MKLIWHIVRKDFRHLRLYLAGWLGMLIAVCLAVRLGWGMHLYWIGVVGTLKVFFLALIVSNLVREDSLVGSTSFWMSRPVSRRQLLAAKSMLLVGTLIIPTLLVEVLFLFFNGVTAQDIVRTIPETVFYSLVATSILFVLAALTRKLPQLLALGLVSLVVLLLFLTVVEEILPPGNRSDASPWAEMTLQSSKWIGFFLCLLVVSVIMVCVQYLTRRTKLNAVLTLLALLPCILTVELWTWDLVATVRRPERKVIDPKLLSVRIDENSLRSYEKASASSRDKRIVLHGPIVVENHPPDLIVAPTQVVSKVSFGSGEFVYRARDVNEYEHRLILDIFDFSMAALDDMRVEILEEALGGVRLLANRYRLEPGYVPKFFDIPEEDFDRSLATAGKLSAKVDFLIHELEVTPMAMESGVQARWGSDHAEFVEVAKMDRRTMWLSMRESKHSLISNRPRWRWYVMRNRSRGEALLGAELSSNFFGGARFVLPTLSFNNLQLHFTLPSDNPSYGPDWFEGAELVRIDITYLDSFSKTIRLENLVMKDIPGP